TLVQHDFLCIAESADYTKTTINEIFNYSLSLSNKEDKGKIIAAKSMWYAHNSMVDEALNVLNYELPRKYLNEPDIINTFKFINELKNRLEKENLSKQKWARIFYEYKQDK